jgi:hypothetical protein
MQHRARFTHLTASLRRRRVRKSSYRLRIAILVFASAVAMSHLALAVEMMPGMDSIVDPGAPSVSHSGGGSYFFEQDLGHILRVRYNTESYGQHGEGHGNVDIGTMQALTFDDAMAFFDGQVTLNDVQGVGFNLGLGYRWLAFQPYASSGGVMQGVSIWADGTSTEANNFFPQVGVSYESLGEMWDLRANGYIPVGQDVQVGDFEETGQLGFQGNNLAQLTAATVDTSFYAGELEIARRVTPERDAWGFAGPYFLANDDSDTLGYRVGARGYALPDVLLQIAVSHDDIFETNAAFSVIWFVGRTRTHFQPACGVPDRFREPVLRNDYVAIAQTTLAGGIPLTDAAGDDIRIVHVDSTAGPGGDGSFENPFDMLTDVNGGGSTEGDVIFVHSNSTFTGENALLKDNQRLLGEGLDADGNPLLHTIATAEQGNLQIPESAPGARNLPRPMILDAIGAAVTIADVNEVANFDIDGGANAILGTDLTGNANIHDISATDTTDFAISLMNVATTSTITLDDFEYDGGTTGGGVSLNNFDGTITATDSTFMNGTLAGLSVNNASDGNITFQNTVTFDSVDGTTIDVNGFTGVMAVNGAITNDTGLSASIQQVSAAGTSVTFGGAITDTGDGIRISTNTGGSILFNGNVDLDTETSDAIVLTTNTGANIDFGGVVDIDTTTGRGFVAMGGGTLTADNPNNIINTDSGQIVRIEDMTLSTTGVTFDEINRSVAGATTNAVLLEDNTGGPITLGRLLVNAGDNGVIEGGTVDAIAVRNSADVSISGIRINNTSAVAGVRVLKTTTGTMALDINDLEINMGSVGIDVAGGAGAGALNMTINDTEIDNPTTDGLAVNGVVAGTISVANPTITTDGADGIQLTNNTGATFTFAGVNVNTTNGTDNSAGRGFVATGGGTLSMTGANNMITTDNGTGLHLEDMTIGTVDVQTVNVDGTTGPANAIILRDLTGGQVAVGPATGLFGAGGTIESTDDAIVVENVQNVDLRQIRIASAGNALGDHGVQIVHSDTATTAMDVTIDGLNVVSAFEAAIDVTGDNTNAFNLRITDGDLENNVAIDITGSGAFGLLVDNNDITTTAANDDAFSLTFSDAATNGDVTFRNGNLFIAGDANALFIDSFDATGKTIDLNIQDSEFRNNSAGSATADIRSRGTTLMNATVQGNTFTNFDAGGLDFHMTSDGASASVVLNLGGTGVDQNVASGGALQEFRLEELNGSDFDVFMLAPTLAGTRNVGTVNDEPNGALQDAPTAPPTPTVP